MALDGAAFRLVVSGIFQVFVGCACGFVPPTQIVHWRAWVAAHIEYAVNGILLAVLGFATPHMSLSPTLLLVFELLAQWGTWSNGTALAIQGLTGIGSPLAPTINAAKGTRVVGEDNIVHYLLMSCGLAVMGMLALAMYGLVAARSKATKAAAIKTD